MFGHPDECKVEDLNWYGFPWSSLSKDNATSHDILYLSASWYILEHVTTDLFGHVNIYYCHDAVWWLQYAMLHKIFNLDDMNPNSKTYVALHIK